MNGRGGTIGVVLAILMLAGCGVDTHVFLGGRVLRQENTNGRCVEVFCDGFYLTTDQHQLRLHVGRTRRVLYFARNDSAACVDDPSPVAEGLEVAGITLDCGVEGIGVGVGLLQRASIQLPADANVTLFIKGPALDPGHVQFFIQEGQP